jgi:hypothetical protein
MTGKSKKLVERCLYIFLGPTVFPFRNLEFEVFTAELYYLYSCPSIIRMIKSRMMRWAGHVARMGERRDAYTILVGKPEGRRPLGRSRRRWVDNIKMFFRAIGCDGIDWIDLAQDKDQWRALVNTVMNLRVP